MMAVLGGLGAGMLACGAVALVAAFDRRIRTRRDLDRLGLDNLLGVVSTRRTDSELDVLAAALRQAEEHRMSLVPLHLHDLLGQRLFS